MSHGKIQGNWYQKQMKGLNLLVVKTFPAMRRAWVVWGKVSFFFCVFSFKWSDCAWQSWEDLLWFSLWLSFHLNFWLEGCYKLMPFQVMQQLFKNCCQHNPTLSRTKETSQHLALFLISIPICGNVYGHVRALHSCCTISTTNTVIVILKKSINYYHTNFGILMDLK